MDEYGGLPPGDYITSYIAQMASTGSIVTEQEAQNLRIQYGLDQPMYMQYYKWMRLIARGDFGMSMEWRRPVTEVIGDRLLYTVVVSFAALLLTWALALPIGIYSAVRQYFLGDYLFTFVGFIGLAVPSFLLALVILYLGFVLFDANIGGLFSTQYQDVPWSLAKVWDLLKHLPIPALILGLAGTAQQIRIMRANLLDELCKPYVVTARAKGLSEARAILKYPVRVALNPFASTIGYLFPYIVSGSIIVSLVLSLPTVGPLLLKAIRLHQHIGWRQARHAAIEMLRRVGIPLPEQRVDQLSNQLSGGLRQRAMIAMALSCHTTLLIADEPTTALDVTTQAQILDLMRQLQRDFGMAIMLITHDLGVIAEMADDVVVMYLGRVVEQAPVDEIFYAPKHPYTAALLSAVPEPDPRRRSWRIVLQGEVANPADPPSGCFFHPRCPFAIELCRTQEPAWQEIAHGHFVSCHRAHELQLIGVDQVDRPLHN